MLRTVLAVLLAVAIVGIANPAIDDARTTRSDHLVRGELATVERTVHALNETEPAMPVGRAGARRVRTVEVPERSRTSAAVDRVTIGGVPDGTTAGAERAGAEQVDTELVDAESGDVLSYARPNGSWKTIRLDDVDLRVARHQGGELRVESDGTPLVLRPGTHRLVFRPVKIDGRRAVLVHRLRAEV